MTEEQKQEPAAPDVTPEQVAHAQGYMSGIVDGYKDVMAICQRLLDTIPPGLRLTQEGQANIALLKSIKDGVGAKCMAAEAQHKAATAFARGEVTVMQ